MLAAAFRLLARARAARAFHPRGLVLDATWQPAPAPGLLPGSPLVAGVRPALVRLSHGVGVPATWPDVVGVAIRILDAHGRDRHQDLLLSSSGTGRLTRHLPQPTRRLDRVAFSSLLPYAVAGLGRRTVVAQLAAGPTPTGYAEVVGPGGLGLPVLEVRIGAVDGPLLATVASGGPVSPWIGEGLRYDPWHTGPELRPVGWVNRLRRPTYAASQEGRGAPAEG